MFFGIGRTHSHLWLLHFLYSLPITVAHSLKSIRLLLKCHFLGIYFLRILSKTTVHHLQTPYHYQFSLYLTSLNILVYFVPPPLEYQFHEDRTFYLLCYSCITSTRVGTTAMKLMQLKLRDSHLHRSLSKP